MLKCFNRVWRLMPGTLADGKLMKKNAEFEAWSPQ